MYKIMNLILTSDASIFTSEISCLTDFSSEPLRVKGQYTVYL